MRALAKLPRPVRERIGRALSNLAENPRPHGMKRLAGMPGLCRIRIGDYRVAYAIEDDRLIVLVVAVGHRSSICSDLS